MAAVTATFVRQELGELNDLEIARIIELGATEADVLEARAWLDGDEQIARELAEPRSGIIEQIIAIAQMALAEEEEEGGEDELGVEDE